MYIYRVMVSDQDTMQLQIEISHDVPHYERQWFEAWVNNGF